MKTYKHLWQYLSQFFLWWEMFQRIFSEKNSLHFIYVLPRNSCSSWDSVEKHARGREPTDDNTRRRMRIARRITKATDTQSEYVICIAFPRQK
jgi:hypothetical protein